MEDIYTNINTEFLFKDENGIILEYIVTNTIKDYPRNISNHIISEINICFDGEGTFFANGKTFNAKKGDFLILNPYVDHATTSKKGGSFYILGLKNIEFNFADDYYYGSLETDYAFKIIELLINIAQSNKEVPDNLPNHLVSAIIDIILHISKGKQTIVYEPKGSSITKKVGKYLKLNYKKDISIDELCKMFFCSKSTITHYFKKDFGVSIKTYLRDLRIEEIKFWLKISDKSINQIASDNGFASMPYFFQYFRKKEGMTPTEYRKIVRKEEKD